MTIEELKAYRDQRLDELWREYEDLFMTTNEWNIAKYELDGFISFIEEQEATKQKTKGMK